jgi:hypothetical protein
MHSENPAALVTETHHGLRFTQISWHTARLEPAWREFQPDIPEAPEFFQAYMLV